MTKAAIQSIRMTEAFLDLVLARVKTTTIRAGHRAYRPGPAALQSGTRSAQVMITSVRSAVFADLREEDARVDGLPSLDALRAAMLGFYPTLKGESPITIVHFRYEALT